MDTIFQKSLNQDLFFLTDGDRSLIYSPLRMMALEVFIHDFEKAKALIEEQSFLDLLNQHPVKFDENQFKNHVGKEYLPTRLILSLTSDCNLRCIYCYAEAGKQHKIMPWSIAKTSIDIMAENLRKTETKKFRATFHGGGEALVVFPLMKECVDYISSIWIGKKAFSIVTNGTLITSEIADWLFSQKFRVTLSFDGPPEVQNFQRPKANGEGSFEDAWKGGVYLKERGVNFGIRATVTNANVFKLQELLQMAKDLGCGLKLEPFTPVGRGANRVELLSIEEYYNQYSQLRSIAIKEGVPLESTYSSYFSPKCFFCAGDGEMFCVLPDGKVSSCSRVTKEDDLLSDTFIIGNVNEQGLIVDPAKVAKLRFLNVMRYEQCNDCFAKWYCAGGCHNTRLLNSGNMSQDHCLLEKQFLWANLIHEVDK